MDGGCALEWDMFAFWDLCFTSLVFIVNYVGVFGCRKRRGLGKQAVRQAFCAHPLNLYPFHSTITDGVRFQFQLASLVSSARFWLQQYQIMQEIVAHCVIYLFSMNEEICRIRIYRSYTRDSLLLRILVCNHITRSNLSIWYGDLWPNNMCKRNL